MQTAPSSQPAEPTSDPLAYSSVSIRRRLAAIIAVVSTLALAVTVVVFVVRNGLAIAIGLVGLSLAVAGSWWFVSENMPRRLLGGIGVVVGLGVTIAAIIYAGSSVERIAVGLALLVALVAIMLASGHTAIRPDRSMDVRMRAGEAPRHAVLLCNPWSGGGKVERFGLVDLAVQLGVETIMLDRGLDLEQLARDAVARGADCLGMAGGDGSQALVASIAIEARIPFVCVSAGTRNHLALDLGLDREDPRRSMYAFRDAIERRIDYATVNDRLFVNDVSLGVYAEIVQQESYRDAKLETTRNLLPEMLGRQAEPFDLQFTTPDGQEIGGAIVVMVSNNPYVTSTVPDAAERHRLDGGELGVFAVTTRTGSDAARLLAASALGQRRRSAFWHEFTASEFEVRSRSGVAFAGVDGEALELPTPLRFRIHPVGLRLLVPKGNLGIAERRRARDVRLKDLIEVAAGREPGTSG